MYFFEIYIKSFFFAKNERIKSALEVPLSHNNNNNHHNKSKICCFLKYKYHKDFFVQEFHFHVGGNLFVCLFENNTQPELSQS